MHKHKSIKKCPTCSLVEEECLTTHLRLIWYLLPSPQIESEAANAKDKSEGLLNKTAAMKKQLAEVQLKVTDNKGKVNDAVNLAQQKEGEAMDVDAVSTDPILRPKSLFHHANWQQLFSA